MNHKNENINICLDNNIFDQNQFNRMNIQNIDKYIEQNQKNPNYISKNMLIDIVQYNNNKYLVCQRQYKNNKQKHLIFILDYNINNHFLIQNNEWYNINNYIGRNFFIHHSMKTSYLHNEIFNRYNFNGKGQIQTIDHINRITTDNRSENLRLISQSEQNNNYKKRKRNINLPENSGININDIPKFVWFQKDRNRFVIEINDIPNNHNIPICKNNKIKITMTGNNNISIKEKLIMTINKLKELKQQYPILKDKIRLSDYSKEQIESIKQYNNILKLSNIPNIDLYLHDIPSCDEIDILPNQQEQQNINEINKLQNGRKVINNIPKNSLMYNLQWDIPKHFYYVKQHLNSGDYFVLDIRHDKLYNLIKYKYNLKTRTSSSKNISIDDKYFEMLQLYIDYNYKIYEYFQDIFQFDH